ncbi:unnamed protein product [Nippostrongylus brasiliensis]|uniref:Phage protein n=1 Tax=Nippostrongylus brasiliensis TaxID=27835 RepID=A0A0N4YKX4_NIPBR|nr:unnamed protein product [Nippostrongylus brasiliensis]
MAVVQATIELVEAIEGVADEFIRDVVKKAYEDYLAGLRQGTKSITALIVGMVLTIIEIVFEKGLIQFRPNFEALETFMAD